MEGKMRNLKESLGFAIPRAIPQIIILSIGLWFIKSNTVITLLYGCIIVIVPIYKYKTLYVSIKESIANIDRIRKSENAIQDIKKYINSLECSEKLISKKHDLYRSLSPLSFLGIITSLLAKIYPNYSNNSIDSVVSKVWNKISILNITLNNFGDIILITILFALIWCAFKTLDTLYKYNNIVSIIRIYKDGLTGLKEGK